MSKESEVITVFDEPECDGYQISTQEQLKAEILEPREDIELRVIKRLYEAITTRKIISVLAILWLENVTRCDFKCTKDFHDKMEKFFTKHFYRGVDLRKARNWSGMERSDLAALFGVSINTIKKMEMNKKPLSQDAIDFIIAMGFKKTVSLKKTKKKTSEANCIQTTKIDKIPPEKKLKKLEVSDQIKCECAINKKRVGK